MTTSLTRPFGDYVHVRQVGELVFLAGQGCRDPQTDTYIGLSFDADGRPVVDAQAQTRAVLDNIERALRSIGADRRALVDITVFLRDFDHFDAMNTAWANFFAETPSPTRTTVGVSDLPGNNWVEMKAIAAHPGGTP